MSDNSESNWLRIILIIISLFIFMSFAPSAAKLWYQVGTGHSIHKELTMAGQTLEQSTASGLHHFRVNRAEKNGIILSVLTVNGTHLPLLFYSILTVIIITTPLSQTVNKKLFRLFSAFFIWGIIFSGLASSMINSLMMRSLPISYGFKGAFVIWLGFTIIFGIILFIGLSIRMILMKSRRAAL